MTARILVVMVVAFLMPCLPLGSHASPSGAAGTEWIEVVVPVGLDTAGTSEPVRVSSVFARAPDPPEVYIGASLGAYLTRDGGASWTALNVPPSRVLVGAPRVTLITVDGVDNIYTAGENITPIRVSHDGGATWIDGLSRSPIGYRNDLLARASSISASPLAEGVAYATLRNPDLRGHTGLAKSVDAGQNWDVSNPTFSGLVAVSPLDSSVVFATNGACLLCRSDDSGLSFAPAASTAPGEPNPLGVQSALAIEPDGRRIWLGAADGALWHSEDQGATWGRIFGPPNARKILSISTPTVDGNVYAVTDDGRLWLRGPIQ